MDSNFYIQRAPYGVTYAKDPASSFPDPLQNYSQEHSRDRSAIQQEAPAHHHRNPTVYHREPYDAFQAILALSPLMLSKEQILKLVQPDCLKALEYLAKCAQKGELPAALQRQESQLQYEQQATQHVSRLPRHDSLSNHPKFSTNRPTSYDSGYHSADPRFSTATTLSFESSNRDSWPSVEVDDMVSNEPPRIYSRADASKAFDAKAFAFRVAQSQDPRYHTNSYPVAKTNYLSAPGTLQMQYQNSHYPIQTPFQTTAHSGMQNRSPLVREVSYSNVGFSDHPSIETLNHDSPTPFLKSEVLVGCPYTDCGLQFKTAREWKNHLIADHDKNDEYQCRHAIGPGVQCSFKNPRDAQWKRHHKRNHKDCNQQNDELCREVIHLQHKLFWACDICDCPPFEDVKHWATHYAEHFFKQSKTASDTSFSTLMRNLLKQPATRESWESQTNGRMQTHWNDSCTDSKSLLKVLELSVYNNERLSNPGIAEIVVDMAVSLSDLERSSTHNYQHELNYTDMLGSTENDREHHQLLFGEIDRAVDVDEDDTGFSPMMTDDGD